MSRLSFVSNIIHHNRPYIPKNANCLAVCGIDFSHKKEMSKFIDNQSKRFQKIFICGKGNNRKNIIFLDNSIHRLGSNKVIIGLPELNLDLLDNSQDKIVLSNDMPSHDQMIQISKMNQPPLYWIFGNSFKVRNFTFEKTNYLCNPAFDDTVLGNMSIVL